MAAEPVTYVFILLAGGLLYLAGPFGVTVFRNVPLNNAVRFTSLAALAFISACAASSNWDGSAPEPVSPPSGTTFNHYPRDTELKWRPVQGAVAYRVEIDCFHCCDLGKWCTDVGKPRLVATDLRATSHRFFWVGANWGRWRVWAVSADGEAGRKSEWQEFLYTR